MTLHHITISYLQETSAALDLQHSEPTQAPPVQINCGKALGNYEVFTPCLLEPSILYPIDESRVYWGKYVFLKKPLLQYLCYFSVHLVMLPIVVTTYFCLGNNAQSINMVCELLCDLTTEILCKYPYDAQSVDKLTTYWSYLSFQ